jgi:hypothetical protein
MGTEAIASQPLVARRERVHPLEPRESREIAVCRANRGAVLERYCREDGIHVHSAVRNSCHPDEGRISAGGVTSAPVCRDSSLLQTLGITRLAHGAPTEGRAFHLLDQLRNIVQQKPRLEIAEVARLDRERLPSAGEALARQSAARGVCRP